MDERAPPGNAPAAEASAERSAWHIPSTEELAALRRRRRQVWLTLIACVVVIVFSYQADQIGFGLALLAMVAAAMYIFGRRAGPAIQPNVRLDRAGFHWGLDEPEPRLIARSDVRAFRIEQAEEHGPGILVLILRDDFESQPITLPTGGRVLKVREFLTGQWALAELPSPVSSISPAIIVRLPIYSEFHAEHRTWHVEGTAAGIAELANTLRRAANELPLPPIGAQAKALEVLGDRRSDSYLLIERTRDVGQDWLADDLISGTSEFLLLLADRMQQAVREAKTSDPSLEISTAGGFWNIELHLAT